MMEALFTLLGTILGFLLSEFSTWRRTSRNEVREAKATRIIVSLEIDLNLESLKEFIKEANKINLEDGDAQKRKKTLARFFTEFPFPNWRKEAFTSQLSVLPHALSEQEVVKVFQFYDRLQRIDIIRNDLLISLELQKSELEGARITKGAYSVLAYLPNHPFNDKASKNWDEGKSLAAQLLAKGNPLKSKKAN